MVTETEWPPIVAVTATIVFFVYYGVIFTHVPPKRSLSFQGRLALHLATSKVGTINDLVMAIFSIGSCILFVWETYIPETEGTPTWMFCTEMVFSTGFAFQYFVSLYTTHNVMAYLVSLQALVDVVTIIPVYVTLFQNQYSLQAGVGFLRFSRIMKFTRVLRLLRLFRSVNVISSATDNAIRHQMILLMTTITSILVVTTGFVQYMGNEIENDQWGAHVGPIAFHDALYFTVVTFTTVGYGDIAPEGVIGRLVITMLIAVTFVLVPFETSKLVRLTRLRSAYSGFFSVADGHAHIVVSLDVECIGIADFLKEFFHEDHGAQNTRVCLLVPGEPTMQMKELLLRHKRVSYLKGDAMSSGDLARARADTAVACFVLTNRFCIDADEQDSITILRALNVKAFNPSLSTYVQIIEPENVCHVVSAGVLEEHVVCVDAAKLGLLGQSCVFPGYSTLVTNLVSSVAYTSANLLEPWQEEYSYGLMQEIYQMTLPDEFNGKRFTVLSHALYVRFNATLFALGVPSPGGDAYDVRLHPGANCVVRAGHVGFIITEDQRAIDQILEEAAAVAEECDRAEKERGGVGAAAQFRQFNEVVGSPAEYAPAVNGGEFVKMTAETDPAGVLAGRYVGVSEPGSPKGGGGAGHGESKVGSPEDEMSGNPSVNPKGGAHLAARSVSDAGVISVHDSVGSGASSDDVQRRRTATDSDAKAGEAGDDADEAPASAYVDAHAGRVQYMVGAPGSRRNVVDVRGPSSRELSTAAFGDDAPADDDAKAEGAARSRGGSADSGTHTGAGAGARAGAGAGSGSGSGSGGGGGGGAAAAVAGALDEGGPGSVLAVANSVLAATNTAASHERRKLARATLLQKFEEVVDNMYGASQSEFFEDLESVLNVVMVEPSQQSTLCVKFTDKAPKPGDGRVPLKRRRRSSFVGKSSLVPRVKRRPFQDAVRDSMAAHASEDEVEPLVRDHVLIVCSNMDDLQHLIAPLRSPYLTRQPPIVILCPNEPDERMWNEMAPFDDVYFVEGVPHLRDLHRAAIATASCAVILARNQEAVEGGQFSANDAEVVLTVLDIQASVRPHMRTLAELNSSRYMKHLGAPMHLRKGDNAAISEVSLNDDAYIFETSFTSGKVLPANFLESLLCQAYFNPFIVLLVNGMVSGCPTEQTQSLTRTERAARMSQLAAKEDDSDADDDSVASDALGVSRERRRRSYAVQVPIPSEFTGTTYSDLFKYMLFEYDMLPIGLYRYGLKLGNVLPFVYTNPRADTVLCPFDLVYVLAPFTRLAPDDGKADDPPGMVG